MHGAAAELLVAQQLALHEPQMLGELLLHSLDRLPLVRQPRELPGQWQDLLWTSSLERLHPRFLEDAHARFVECAADAANAKAVTATRRQAAMRHA